MRKGVIEMRRGFTFIEMLVVIAIMLILASILYPVFVYARNMKRVSDIISERVSPTEEDKMMIMDHWDTMEIIVDNREKLEMILDIEPSDKVSSWSIVVELDSGSIKTVSIDVPLGDRVRSVTANPPMVERSVGTSR